MNMICTKCKAESKRGFLFPQCAVCRAKEEYKSPHPGGNFMFKRVKGVTIEK